MALYFLRHGQSQANIDGNFAGQKDNSPLTADGVKQAQEAAAHWNARGIPLKKIVSSPLIRALETAHVFAKGIGFSGSIEINEGLIEYDMGVLTGKPIKDIDSLGLISVDGVENVELFQSRILDVIKNIYTLKTAHCSCLMLEWDE